MSTYARIANNVVAELFVVPGGFTLAQCFAPAIAAQFVAVPAGVTPKPGWTYADGKFNEPAAAAAAKAAP